MALGQPRTAEGRDGRRATPGVDRVWAGAEIPLALGDALVHHGPVTDPLASHQPLGATLRRLRAERGLTQAGAAAQVHACRRAWAAWEAGTHPRGGAHREALARWMDEPRPPGVDPSADRTALTQAHRRAQEAESRAARAERRLAPMRRGLEEAIVALRSAGAHAAATRLAALPGGVPDDADDSPSSQSSARRIRAILAEAKIRVRPGQEADGVARLARTLAEARKGGDR